MRLRLLVLLFGIAACGNSQSAGPTAPTLSSTVRVLTWNVQQSSGTRIDTQVDLIASTRPDVIVLQEAYRGELERFRAALVSRTGREWDARYAAAVRRPDRNEGAGLIVLSAFPIIETESIQMPYADAWTESRPVLRVRVDALGTLLDVLTTHLAAGDQGLDARRQQVRRLLEWTASSAGPMILGGDLNAEPSSQEIAALRSKWTDAWVDLGRAGGATFSSDRPTRRIDYWLVARSGNGSLAPMDAAVIEACAAGGCLSDHNALLAVFRLFRP